MASKKAAAPQLGQKTLASFWGAPKAAAIVVPRSARDGDADDVDSAVDPAVKPANAAVAPAQPSPAPESASAPFEEAAPAAPASTATKRPASAVDPVATVPKRAKASAAAAKGKEKAAAPAAASKAKPGAAAKGKAAGGAAASVKLRFKKTAITGVNGADYYDRDLAFTSLRDGRELLLCKEAWVVPEGFAANPAARPPTKAATLPDGVERFCPIPGTDLLAAVVSAPFRRGEPGKPQRLAVLSLPDCLEAGSVELPFDAADTASYRGTGSVQHMASAPGANGVLITTPRYVFYVRIEEGESAEAPQPEEPVLEEEDAQGAEPASEAAEAEAVADAQPRSARRVKLTVAHAVDLYATAASPLAAAALPHGPGDFFLPEKDKKKSAFGGSSSSSPPAPVKCAALFVDPSGAPFALLGCEGGCVLVVPVGEGEAPLRPAGRFAVHGPMKRSDKESAVYGIDVWYREGGAASIVTVGSDGNCCVAPLHDGEELRCSEHGCAQEEWHATSNGSGCSKQYAYAISTMVSVHSPSGVVCTGSWSEAVLHFYDLESKNSTQAGKLLSHVKKLADGLRPSRTSIFSVAFSPSGLLAYVNSNDGDDGPLKIIRGVGGGGGGGAAAAKKK